MPSRLGLHEIRADTATTLDGDMRLVAARVTGPLLVGRRRAIVTIHLELDELTALSDLVDRVGKRFVDQFGRQEG